MVIKGIDVDRPVQVYRNLRHGIKSTPLYSVMQDGKVKARLHRVILANAKFTVRESGRQRVLQTKRKNVHAFVVGRIANSTYTPKGKPAGAFGTDENDRNPRGLGVEIKYNPYLFGYFYYADGLGRVSAARGVLLNERGISATYTD